VVKIAEAMGRTPSQVSLNWVRQQPGVIIPILDARTVPQVQDNLGCLEFTLAEEQIQQLNAVSKIELGFPHDFLASDGIRDVVYGGMFSKIEAHRR
jgi:aryl-alcohol dehydrogenase-like predicted oxidoreductase